MACFRLLHDDDDDDDVGPAHQHKTQTYELLAAILAVYIML